MRPSYECRCGQTHYRGSLAYERHIGAPYPCQDCGERLNMTAGVRCRACVTVRARQFHKARWDGPGGASLRAEWRDRTLRRIEHATQGRTAAANP